MHVTADGHWTCYGLHVALILQNLFGLITERFNLVFRYRLEFKELFNLPVKHPDFIKGQANL